MADKKLKKQVLELKEKVSELEDENRSLWMMLDEMHQSDIKNYRKALEDVVAAATLSIALKNGTGIAEA